MVLPGRRQAPAVQTDEEYQRETDDIMFQQMAIEDEERRRREAYIKNLDAQAALEQAAAQAKPQFRSLSPEEMAAFQAEGAASLEERRNQTPPPRRQALPNLSPGELAQLYPGLPPDVISALANTKVKHYTEDARTSTLNQFAAGYQDNQANVEHNAKVAGQQARWDAEQAQHAAAQRFNQGAGANGVPVAPAPDGMSGLYDDSTHSNSFTAGMSDLGHSIRRGVWEAFQPPDTPRPMGDISGSMRPSTPGLSEFGEPSYANSIARQGPAAPDAVMPQDVAAVDPAVTAALQQAGAGHRRGPDPNQVVDPNIAAPDLHPAGPGISRGPIPAPADVAAVPVAPPATPVAPVAPATPVAPPVAHHVSPQDAYDGHVLPASQDRLHGQARRDAAIRASAARQRAAADPIQRLPGWGHAGLDSTVDNGMPDATDALLRRAEAIEEARNDPRMSEWNAGMDAIRARSAERDASLPARQAADEAEYLRQEEVRLHGPSLHTERELNHRSRQATQNQGLLEAGRQFQREGLDGVRLDDAMSRIPRREAEQFVPRYGSPAWDKAVEESAQGIGDWGPDGPPGPSMEDVARDTKAQRLINDMKARFAAETPEQKLEREEMYKRELAVPDSVMDRYRAKNENAMIGRDRRRQQRAALYGANSRPGTGVAGDVTIEDAAALAHAKRMGPKYVAAYWEGRRKSRDSALDRNVQIDAQRLAREQLEQQRRDSERRHGDQMGAADDARDDRRTARGDARDKADNESDDRRDRLDFERDTVEDALNLKKNPTQASEASLNQAKERMSDEELDKQYKKTHDRNKGEWVLAKFKQGFKSEEILASMKRVWPDWYVTSGDHGPSLEDPTRRTMTQYWTGQHKTRRFWFGDWSPGDYPLPKGYADKVDEYMRLESIAAGEKIIADEEAAAAATEAPEVRGGRRRGGR